MFIGIHTILHSRFVSMAWLQSLLQAAKGSEAAAHGEEAPKARDLLRSRDVERAV